MRLYEEQIRNRIHSDEEQFQTAFAKLVGVVMGRKVAETMNNQRQKTKNAIDEILKFYGYKTQDVPSEVQELNDLLEYQLRPSSRCWACCCRC